VFVYRTEDSRSLSGETGYKFFYSDLPANGGGRGTGALVEHGDTIIGTTALSVCISYDNVVLVLCLARLGPWRWSR
jgi:hypothetical protein